jgi:hypothetical protein
MLSFLMGLSLAFTLLQRNHILASSRTAVFCLLNGTQLFHVLRSVRIVLSFSVCSVTVRAATTLPIAAV